MPDQVILLRLEGPLQSWGTRSRWDVRDTGTEPTKSGVIGLLGCALGYPLGDPRLERLSASLLFGVRVEAPGRVIRDFQTVSGYLPTADGRFRHTGVKTATNLGKLEDNPDAIPAIIVSPRFYLEDSAFLAGVAAAPGSEMSHASLGEIREALRRPAWPLYLGRKACIPTRPILDETGGPYSGLEDALRRHPWSHLGRENQVRDSKPERLTAYIEDPTGSLVRMDALRLNQARQYAPRRAREMKFDTPATANGGVS